MIEHVQKSIGEFSFREGETSLRLSSPWEKEWGEIRRREERNNAAMDLGLHSSPFPHPSDKKREKEGEENWPTFTSLSFSLFFRDLFAVSFVLLRQERLD